jgi:hypothetical protein
VGVGDCLRRWWWVFGFGFGFAFGLVALRVWLFAYGVAFPCFHVGLFVLPLCGAAPTFLCRRKEK